MGIGTTEKETMRVAGLDKANPDRVVELDRDKAIVLASEEVTRRNVSACVDHANGTRKYLREVEQRMDRLEDTVRALSSLVEAYRTQLATLQQQFYAAGTTSYADQE